MIEKLKKTGIEEAMYESEDGIAYKSKANYLQIEHLGFCGCGNPDEAMIYVRDFLKKLDERDWGDYEDMAYMFLCYWADDKGFSEHGTTVRCSWLTPKGKELLQDIETVIEEEL